MTESVSIDLRRPDPPQAPRFLFTGRLDNRRRLAAELGRPAPTPGAAADAALARAAWERWGATCAERFLGPFAFVAWDPFRRRVVAARDALGERTLCYAHDPDRGLLVAAFDEGAVLAHPAVPATPDDDTWARWFAVEPPRPGATFYAAVRELPPAGRLLVDAAGARCETWWHPPSADSGERRSDADWCALFRATLEESVAACLEGTGERAGVLLSGGLDSSSVALLAARQGTPPLALSWVFDAPELAACDERRWIADVVRRGGLEARRVVADDAVPLAGATAELTLPDRPPGNPYRPLKQRLYAAAREAGVGVVLTGACGDLLWTGGRRGAAASLLAAGRPLAAAGELSTAAAERRWGDLLQAAAGLAPVLPRRRRRARPWLRPEVARRLDDAPATGDVTARRAAALTGLRAARGVSGETAWAAREGVEVRDPYRDRRMVELALALPARLLHRRGEDKVLLRRALADLLPPSVARRRGSAPLLPLFLRGVCGVERGRARRLLERGERWRRYVREEWLDATLKELSAGPIDRRPRGAAAVAVWRCLAAELWEELNSGMGQRASSRSFEALERSA